MDQFKCGPSMVTFDFFLLGGSEFWNFVGPKMNSCDQILINFPKKILSAIRACLIYLSWSKNYNKKTWLKPSQSCCHQSYPKSAKSLFGNKWLKHYKIWLLKTLRSQYWYIDGAKCNAINHIGSPAAAEEKG